MWKKMPYGWIQVEDQFLAESPRFEDTYVPPVKAAPTGRPLKFKNFRPRKSQRRNDCAVVAIANILQISHDEARAMMFRYGYSSTYGTPRDCFKILLKHKKLILVPSEIKPIGMYVVFEERHVYTVYDGKSYNGPYGIAQESYEIQEQ